MFKKIDEIIKRILSNLLIMPPKKSQPKKSKKKDEEEYTPEIEEEEEVIDDTEDYPDEEEILEEDEEEEQDDEDIKFIDEEGKECAVEKALEDDNEYFENEDDIEIQPNTTVQYVKKEERVSSAKLTKYEMVRILGERTKQLTMGAKPLIKNFQGLPYDRIAEEELKLNMIPFLIERPLPNGSFELWKLEELQKDHLLSLLE
jgi:DNA-directed RNA polymerase subunit K/omega